MHGKGKFVLGYDIILYPLNGYICNDISGYSS